MESIIFIYIFHHQPFLGGIVHFVITSPTEIHGTPMVPPIGRAARRCARAWPAASPGRPLADAATAGSGSRRPPGGLGMWRWTDWGAKMVKHGGTIAGNMRKWKTYGG